MSNNKMPDDIVVGVFNQKRYWQDKDPLNEISDATSYTRTDLYTAVCAERDALRALCEGMAEKLRLIDGLDGEINLSNYTDTDVSYLNGQFVQAILTAAEALTSYENHKGAG